LVFPVSDTNNQIKHLILEYFNLILGLLTLLLRTPSRSCRNDVIVCFIVPPQNFPGQHIVIVEEMSLK
jgi:hypothetical protein